MSCIVSCRTLWHRFVDAEERAKIDDIIDWIEAITPIIDQLADASVDPVRYAGWGVMEAVTGTRRVGLTPPNAYITGMRLDLGDNDPVGDVSAKVYIDSKLLVGIDAGVVTVSSGNKYQEILVADFAPDFAADKVTAGGLEIEVEITEDGATGGMSPATGVSVWLYCVPTVDAISP